MGHICEIYSMVYERAMKEIEYNFQDRSGQSVTVGVHDMYTRGLNSLDNYYHISSNNATPLIIRHGVANLLDGF